LQLDEPVLSEKVQVNKQMRLKDIARTLNIPVKILEELNPSLRYKATPNYPFTLNLPMNTSSMFLANIEQIPKWKPPQRSYVVHRVRFGETLSEIAVKYRVPVRRIVYANRLRSASRIRAGQRLRIPLRGHLISTRSFPAAAPGSTVRYRVRRGDSLWLIAQRYNTTVSKIKALNGIRSDLLHAGQVILVQAGTR
jgi:membrane-bound lytic murein transglycosylase D